jgi:hypothetical protein
MTLDTRARRAAQGIHRAVEVMELSTFTEVPRKVERFDRFRDRRQRGRRISAIVVAAALMVAAVVVVSTNALDRGQGSGPADQGGDQESAASTVPTPIGTLAVSGAGCRLEAEHGPPVAGLGRLTLVNNTTNRDAWFLLLTFDREVLTFERLEAALPGGILKPGPDAPPRLRLPGAFGVRLVAVRPGTTEAINEWFARGAYAILCDTGRLGGTLVGPIVFE